MDEKALFALLWDNVKTLMQKRYEAERLGQFAADCGIGGSTMTRLKKKETAAGIDTLNSIAGAFDIEPWQLIAPDLGAGLYRLSETRQFVPAFDQSADMRIAEPAPGESSTWRGSAAQPRTTKKRPAAKSRPRTGKRPG